MCPSRICSRRVTQCTWYERGIRLPSLAILIDQRGPQPVGASPYQVENERSIFISVYGRLQALGVSAIRQVLKIIRYPNAVRTYVGNCGLCDASLGVRRIV